MDIERPSDIHSGIFGTSDLISDIFGYFEISEII